MSRPTRVAVALGSGGARGYAHIGALQILDERGYDVVAISGSSMGALVGGLYCAGKLDEYVEWVMDLKQFDVVRLMDLTLGAAGVIHAEKILLRVREIVGDVRIEDLPIPFTAVATDLTAGRPIWFQDGPVDTAIRASIAIPGVITPHVMGERVLVDGGILDPLPVAPTAAAQADLTVGVNLGADAAAIETVIGAGSRSAESPMSRLRKSAGPLLDSEMIRSVVERFTAVADIDDAETVDTAVTGPYPDGLLEDQDTDYHGPKITRFAVLMRSLDVMQETLARYQLDAYPPDVVVRVPRNSCRSLDFHRAAEMIALGRTLTEAALDQQLR